MSSTNAKHPALRLRVEYPDVRFPDYEPMRSSPALRSCGTSTLPMTGLPRIWLNAWFWLPLALLVTTTVYWPGLSGGWLLDDYPSIVANHAVQPAQLTVASLLDAALSSTASEFKRPLASLSFALNYRASGLDPHAMKLTNLVFHLLNGVLVFLLARALLRATRIVAPAVEQDGRNAITAVLIATAWMLLPINLTGVLYVVQRMESMANIFVLLGLLGYVSGRSRMLTSATAPGRSEAGTGGFLLCVLSVTIPTALGVLAKETAVMLPLYALLVEWAVFHDPQAVLRAKRARTPEARKTDRRIGTLFAIVLVLPMLLGMLWLVKHVLPAQAWATRDFTLGTRLLSEARIVLDYIQWTLLPSTHALSFYHDTFEISSGWLRPWTTLASVLGLLALLVLTVWLRRRMALAALGLALFLGAQLLTGTVLPLELIYEHRNYFASFGLLLALVPLLTAPSTLSVQANGQVAATLPGTFAAPAGDSPTPQSAPKHWNGRAPYPRLRYTLMGVLLLAWSAQTALGAYVWGSPLRLATALADRAPDSPRAQYDLGRRYSAYSQYNPTSSFVPLAYAALENAARLPESSILPEQALILMNARMHLPAKDIWWESLLAKLKAHPPTVEDQSALRTLSICALERQCDLPRQRMIDAYGAALSHPNPGAQLQARYGDYAWNLLGDRVLGERMLAGAVQTNPREPDYLTAWITMLTAQGRVHEARQALEQLEALNLGGRLDQTVTRLHALPGLQ